MINLPLKITNQEVVMSVVFDELPDAPVFRLGRSNEGLADDFDQTVLDGLYDEFKVLAAERLAELTPDTKVEYYDGEAKEQLTKKQGEDALKPYEDKPEPTPEEPAVPAKSSKRKPTA